MVVNNELVQRNTLKRINNRKTISSKNIFRNIDHYVWMLNWKNWFLQKVQPKDKSSCGS